MKKYFLSVACLCLCAGFVFTSCKKDDDDDPGTSSITSITAKVENGSSYDDVTTVKGFLGGSEVVSGSYTNGGFTLSLPGDVSTNYFMTVADFITEYTLIPAENLTISNTEAKMGMAYFMGFDKSGEDMGDFEYTNDLEGEGSKITDGWFIYVTADVDIKGSYSVKEGGLSGTISMNVSLKKGWNIVYNTYTYTTDSYTTSDPGGLKWFFDVYSGYKSFQTESVAKFAGSKKLMFKGLK